MTDLPSIRSSTKPAYIYLNNANIVNKAVCCWKKGLPMAAIKPKNKNCSLCSTQFIATSNRQYICSPECALAWNSTINQQTGCWEKQGPYRGQRGYCAVQHKGDDDYGHRFSYRLLIGPIPDDMIVRHKCDNPPCFNPDHLELGTHDQNMEDMRSRNRSGLGRRNTQAKLTEIEVLEIASSAESRQTLAERFGVHPSNIRSIQSGNSWSHITGIGRTIQ